MVMLNQINSIDRNRTDADHQEQPDERSTFAGDNGLVESSTRQWIVSANPFKWPAQQQPAPGESSLSPSGQHQHQQHQQQPILNDLGQHLKSLLHPNERGQSEQVLYSPQACAAGSWLPGSGGQSAANCTGQEAYYNLNRMPMSELNFTDFEDVWFRKSWTEILLRVSFVAPIVLLGIIGNATIIYSMCRFKPFRTKPTNIFILNMAIADLLTTIVCPNAALLTDIYQFYVLGAFICRFEGFVKITCLLVSSYSLIVLSVDWLLCVVRPCRSRISTRQSWLVLAAIWISSILMASPLFVWRQLRERQWNDLLEVWCCEMIQYTKYYWVVITFFLIYLPTFFMTIVLIVILAQMDKFEAKLRRSRAASQTGPSASTSINMKYRRRIAKILFSYLLSSIVCWTPLQFTIIYRHFRSEAIPSPWFFELVFFSQLSASLTAATNPIIFGFLSQPFRLIVARSFKFSFLNRLVANTNTRNNNSENKNDMLAMSQRNLNHNLNHNNHRPAQSNELNVKLNIDSQTTNNKRVSFEPPAAKPARGCDNMVFVGPARDEHL